MKTRNASAESRVETYVILPRKGIMKVAIRPGLASLQLSVRHGVHVGERDALLGWTCYIPSA